MPDRLAGFTTLERVERSSQLYALCCRCQTWHPVNVEPRNDDLIVQPGRIIFDPRVGFLCPPCADVLYRPEDETIHFEDIRDKVTALIAAHPDGLSVRQVSEALNISRGRASYYCHVLMRDDVVTRTVQRGQEDRYTLAPANTVLEDILEIEK